MKRIIIFILSLSIHVTIVCGQQLRLPRFFSDGMVVQRDSKIPVWGKSAPGDNVLVSLNGKKSQSKADAEGKWKVYLPKQKAGGPYVLSISNGREQVEIKNVLVGDVFLCSGQSNMELPIRRCMDVVKNEVKDYRNDQIRYLKFPHQYNYVRPNDDVQVIPWQDITPENCAEVSGICYFMARNLQEKYHVPIGIINSSVGGTRVEAWMPHEVLATYDGYAEELKKPKYHQTNWPDSIRRLENAAGMQWERKMMSADTIVNVWKQDGYSFASWKPVDMFSNWSEGKNGSFWFHTTVTVPSGMGGQAATLRFGAMKDADTIYVNNQYVGNTTYEYPPRIYKVKEGILHEGKNDIVVHLMSQSGRANFTKGKLYQLEIGEKVIPLSTTLEMAVGSIMPRKPGSTYFVDGNTGLYNAMIAPLQDFAFKGILWYQGESNQGNTRTYASLLKGMVGAWRQQFGKDLPFVIMQLPGYMSRHDHPVETGWTQIRHQQYLASQNIPNSALAPTLDTGEYNDIHPQDKKTAGLRAALQMEKLAYKEKKLVSSGPTPIMAEVKDGLAILTFSKESGELEVRGNGLKDFAIKVNGKYQWADAQISGSHQICITLPSGLESTTVRYCWDDYPQPSLYNKEGIPAPQFEISTK